MNNNVTVSHFWPCGHRLCAHLHTIDGQYAIAFQDTLLIGASLSEPHCYVANRGKRNALWCVRTRNFSTVIKIPSACDRNFCQFVVNLPIVFPSSQLLRQFAWLRKTLHISQDVICWQSWSNNNSKYGLVRRTYTIYCGRTRCFRASWRICF